MIKLPYWPEAPDDVLRFRAAGVVVTVLTYIVVRADHVNTAAEMLTTLALAMVGVFVFENSVVRLALRSMDHREAAERPTEVIPPVHEWPDATELAIAEARHEATHALVDRGVLSEHLFTHDVLCEPTPPHGVAAAIVDDVLPEQCADLLTRLGVGSLTTGMPPRHRLAESQLQRERAWQVFGEI